MLKSTKSLSLFKEISKRIFWIPHNNRILIIQHFDHFDHLSKLLTNLWNYGNSASLHRFFGKQWNFSSSSIRNPSNPNNSCIVHIFHFTYHFSSEYKENLKFYAESLHSFSNILNILSVITILIQIVGTSLNLRSSAISKICSDTGKNGAQNLGSVAKPNQPKIP